MAIASDLSITFAKDQLGHTNELTTLRNYAKTNKSMIENGIISFIIPFDFIPEKISCLFCCTLNVREIPQIYLAYILVQIIIPWKKFSY